MISVLVHADLNHEVTQNKGPFAANIKQQVSLNWK